MTDSSTASGRKSGTAERRILDAAMSAFIKHGYDETSTLEIAKRARVSKRDIYAAFGNKQQMLMACILERTGRLQPPDDLPEPRDRESLGRALTAFGTQILTVLTDPAAIGVLRIAIAQAPRDQKIAKVLSERRYQPALEQIMSRARAARLVAGRPAEMTEHFSGLLWGDLMLQLLLGVAKAPDAKEIARRASTAAAGFLRQYPEGDTPTS